MKVINIIDFLKELKRLFDVIGLEELLFRVEKFVNIIRKYKFLIILFFGGGIDFVIEIFIRLNRIGVEILFIDIIKVLNYD